MTISVADQTWYCAVTKEEGVKEKTFDLGKAQYVIGYDSKPQAIIPMKGIWWLITWCSINFALVATFLEKQHSSIKKNPQNEPS